MKIVYIASRSINEIGGIETYMKNLLPKLSDKGYEIVLYTEGGFFLNSEYRGIEIIEVPAIKSKFLNKIMIGAISTIHSILFNRNVDIYHYNANAAALLSFVPNLLGKKVVYQGHGLEWKRAKWSGIMQNIIQYLDDFVILTNNNITMVSDEQSEYIKSHYNKNSITINSGVDISDVVYDKDTLNQYGLEEESYILYLGRLVPEKKADILIDSFIKLNDKNLKLVIAGDDPNELEYIKSLKEKANGQKNIYFLGSVYGDNKNALLQYCKIFCIPSELEGLPITLLEAMSYERLCIASDIQANKEALSSYGTYFNVNDSESLVRAISYANKEYESLSTMRVEAKKRISENFTWDIISEKFDSYYNSI